MYVRVSYIFQPTYVFFPKIRIDFIEKSGYHYPVFYRGPFA